MELLDLYRPTEHQLDLRDRAGAAFVFTGECRAGYYGSGQRQRLEPGAEERDEGFYENVEAPGKEWERLDLRMGGKGTEPVFRSDKVDELLRSDRPLDIVRDRDYEKRLNNHISRKENWENTYRKFLRHNHREAMYSGKQLYNEISTACAVSRIRHIPKNP